MNERRCSGSDKQQKKHPSGLSVLLQSLLLGVYRSCDAGGKHF